MKPSTVQPTLLATSKDRSGKLAAFITSRLPSGLECGAITLVARSAASPAAEALVQLGPELAVRGVRVRVIFTTLVAEGASVDWSAATDELPFAREVRWASHPRIAEAHEQLVVADEACWIGDCMRRDPAKRDAFERYSDDDATATRSAVASFERLWSRAQPVAIRQARPDNARLS